MVDLHEDLAAILPDFSDRSLLEYPLTPSYVPPVTRPLPRAPAFLRALARRAASRVGAPQAADVA